MAGKGRHGRHMRRSTDFPGSEEVHSEEQHEGLKEPAEESGALHSESARSAQEIWRGAREGFQEGYTSLSARARDVWGDGVAFVRRYPLASLGVAFGIGCLASCAWFFAQARSTEDVAQRMSRR